MKVLTKLSTILMMTEHPLTSGGLSILSCADSLEGGVVMGHPQTLVGFMEMYPTQDACRRALFEQRWREGFRCPRCAHEAAWYLRGRGLLRVRGLRLPGVGDRGHAAPQDAHRPAQVAAGDLAAGLDEEAALGGGALASAGRDGQDRVAAAPQDHARHAPRRARAAAARRGRARRVADRRPRAWQREARANLAAQDAGRGVS